MVETVRFKAPVSVREGDVVHIGVDEARPGSDITTKAYVLHRADGTRLLLDYEVVPCVR